MKKLIFILSLVILLAVATKPTHAADCEVVYGGGETECVKAQTVTPIEQEDEPTATPTTPPSATQSKGGLPIQKAPESKTAPATGPEAFALMSLIPMAAAGFYLRRKS